MVTADQLVWVLGTGIFGLCAWALAKIFDRTVQDIAAIRTHLYKLTESVQTQQLKLSLIEERLKDLDP